MNSRMISMVLVSAALLVVGCQKNQVTQSSQTWTESTQPMAVLRDFNGNDAGFTELGVVIIDSEKSLEQSGSVQLSTLDVDFEKEMVVVLALGQQPTGGYWARITGVQLGKSGGLYVQGFANRPDDTSAVTGAVTCPIHAVVVNKRPVSSIHPEIDSVVGQTMQ